MPPVPHDVVAGGAPDEDLVVVDVEDRTGPDELGLAAGVATDEEHASTVAPKNR